MPKGSQGEKRPADMIGNAVHIMRIATGKAKDAAPDDRKDKAARRCSKGRRKRAESMSPERRAEIAKTAAAKRWGL